MAARVTAQAINLSDGSCIMIHSSHTVKSKDKQALLISNFDGFCIEALEQNDINLINM